MDNETSVNTLKSRSIRACLVSGFQLYANHFRTLLKRAWLTAIIYSVVTSALGLFAVLTLPRLAVELTASAVNGAVLSSQTMTIAGGFVALLLLFTLVASWLASYGFGLLREFHYSGKVSIPQRVLSFHFDKNSCWRTVKAAFFMIAILAVVAVLLVLAYWGLRHVLSPWTALAALAVIGLVAALLLLPLTYTTAKYLIASDASFWRTTLDGYSTGLRRMGIVFSVNLVTLIIVGIVQAFASMPAIILMIANTQANIGTLMGDPLGMPAYMIPMTAIVFCLSSAVQALAHMFSLFPVYYMYCAIEATEKEIRDEKNLIH